MLEQKIHILKNRRRKCKIFSVMISIIILISLLPIILQRFRHQHHDLTHDLPTNHHYHHPIFISQYLNLSQRSFILEPSESKTRFCTSKLIIAIASGIDKVDERTAIRETWGSDLNLINYSASLVFVIGQPADINNNNTWQETLEKESHQYDDIVQETFLDTYKNLTLKSIAALKWIHLSCSAQAVQPKYVLKVDTDMFINLENLMKILDGTPEEYQMLGRLQCGARVDRNESSKFYTPEYEYPVNRHPCYLSGTAYILRGSIIPKLLATSSLIPLYHAEDVYVTGLLRAKAKFLAKTFPYFCCPSTPIIMDDCYIKTAVTIHAVVPKMVKRMWKLISSSSSSPSSEYNNRTCFDRNSIDKLCSYKLYQPKSYHE